MLNDNQARQQATNPNQSFIVQAPAGSGKTEILTQRFLRLLSTVHAPEQIMALTFTKKAANEMRERIVRTMQQVANGVLPQSAHQATTFAYAKDALDKNEQLGWNVLQQPNRLRIITIDSLCQSLTQAIVLQHQSNDDSLNLRHAIYSATISDKPQALYLAAASNCLTLAINNPAYHQSIRQLLEHLDNRQDHLLSLFVELLSKRDQWLASMGLAKRQEQAQYEQAIALIEQHEIARFKKTIPIHCKESLRQLAQQVTLIEANPLSPRNALSSWSEFEQLNGSICASLSALILTGDNKIRKGFDHHVGLKRGNCPDALYSEIKTASQQLLADLSLCPDFLEQLLRIKNLPQPHYNTEQWQVLQALFTILPMLSEQLALVFTQHDAVDFSALSQQALHVLGDTNNPINVALYLGHDIEHILVDEFQDTSIQQAQLLQQLVYHWQADDGKTLFVVGDPMQSIYRFRAAEVGLFLKAHDQGMGNVCLTPLQLRCNFRSTGNIVNWVNTHFQYIFPSVNDIESGAVTFHASDYIKPVVDETCIHAFACDDKEQQALHLVQCVALELANHPNDTIAILVRSRNQLTQIIQELRRQHIPFQGVDIDLLAHLPHLRDVWSLTQALLMPGNRRVWLEVLRSPWCGLSLSDIHTLANFSKSHSIEYALSQIDVITHLSDDGKIRAQFVYNILHNALLKRYQQSLVDWIEDTLNQLHLHHILSPIEQDDLEQYWMLLEKFETAGCIQDWALFKNEFNTLYSQRVTPSKLHIMTIHKSKGLEFDCVLLPCLSSRSPQQDTPLLRWLNVPTEQDGNILLVSPIKAAHHDNNALYDYLGQLEYQKGLYEQQRLLYVAVTRAKQRLYLFDHRNADKPPQGSFRSLLKHQVFQSIESETILPTSNDTHVRLPTLYRLPVSFYESHKTPKTDNAKRLIHITCDSTPRLLGIIAHRLLQWMCDHHPKSGTDIPWELAIHLCKTMGLEEDTLALIKPYLIQVFNDPIGSWIIQAHEQERNEYAVLTNQNNEVVTRIIDRTFVDQGIRWIIDFKTGQDDLTTQTQHRQQVNEYASLLAHQSQEPIQCGLYYLASGTWVHWDYLRDELLTTQQ